MGGPIGTTNLRRERRGTFLRLVTCLYPQFSPEKPSWVTTAFMVAAAIDLPTTRSVTAGSLMC
jgi:hypothetical protein